MYFPYLRGKQFELLAIKELADAFAQSGHVLPVVEPVRELGGALQRSFAELRARNVQHALVLNPGVGHLAAIADGPRLTTQWIGANIQDDDYLQLAVLVNSRANFAELASGIREAGLTGRPMHLIHEEYVADYSELLGLMEVASSVTNFVESKTVVRRYGGALSQLDNVQFADGFLARDTNMLYLDQPVSLLTDQHLYFDDDGYVGFSDYLTVGARYSEGGSLPRALIIHFSYQDPSDNMIYIRHFGSDSNRDQSDTAGKFAEALKKLITFVDENSLRNPAIDAFRAYYETETYPGLGVIKKLSMENHLFLMMKVLAGN